jgi:hypothetical protein
MTPQELALREINRQIARIIKDELPPDAGFTLLVYNFGPNGYMTYSSNANREDMVAAMIELLGRLLKGDDNNEREIKV